MWGSGNVGVHIAFGEVEKTGGIVGGEDLGDLFVEFGVGERRRIDERADFFDAGPERGIGGAEETRIVVGTGHATGFEAVSGDEVAHRVERHAGEIVEVSVTASDEFIDEADFFGSHGGVVSEFLGEDSRRVPVFEGTGESLDTEESVGVSAAVKRIDDSGGGGEESPIGTGGFGIETLDAGESLDFLRFGGNGEGVGELRGN